MIFYIIIKTYSLKLNYKTMSRDHVSIKSRVESLISFNFKNE
jgi:hypothetical protein